MDRDDMTWQERLIHTLTRKIEEDEKVLAKLATELKNDPCYALEWSKGAFSSAARMKVFGYIRGRLSEDNEGKTILDSLLSYCVDEVLRKARNGSNHSTSPTSNLIEEYTLTAWSELAEHVKWANAEEKDSIRHRELEARKVTCPRCRQRLLPEAMEGHKFLNMVTERLNICK
jgi:hypothetical protein